MNKKLQLLVIILLVYVLCGIVTASSPLASVTNLHTITINSDPFTWVLWNNYTINYLYRFIK